jgi:hypothetical protein
MTFGEGAMKARHLLLGTIALFALTTVAEAQKQKAPRRDRNRITAEEIAERATAQNAFDVIKALRPQWFSSRGPTTILMQEVGIVVYRGPSRLGSVDELRSIPADQIEELRFYSPGDATMRFGTDHPSGAIEVEMKR